MPEYIIHAIAICLVYGRMISVVVLSLALVCYLGGALYFGWVEKNPYNRYVEKKKKRPEHIEWGDG